MIKQLEDVLERVKAWPEKRQEDAVRILEHMDAIGTGAYELSDDERADLLEALAEIERGEVASDAEVASFFASLRK